MVLLKKSRSLERRLGAGIQGRFGGSPCQPFCRRSGWRAPGDIGHRATAHEIRREQGPAIYAEMAVDIFNLFMHRRLTTVHGGGNLFFRLPLQQPAQHLAAPRRKSFQAAIPPGFKFLSDQPGDFFMDKCHQIPLPLPGWPVATIVAKAPVIPGSTALHADRTQQTLANPRWADLPIVHLRPVPSSLVHQSRLQRRESWAVCQHTNKGAPQGREA